MFGEKSLHKLLQSMQPKLADKDYVFVSLPTCTLVSLTELEAIGTFHEQEGVTVILPKDKADQKGFNYRGVFNLISLHVHSSLEAVGLTAAVSKALADNTISANIVAAFYHDHIFVPNSQAQQALACLTQLSQHYQE